MNNDQQKLLSIFEDRVAKLMHYCDDLKQERAMLRKQLEKREEEISSLKGRLFTSNTDNEFLKHAKVFSSYPEEKEKAKRRISKLVREVDKCIALLNE
jgi:predicted  nucleic acid-binding Zn-ribbon protein